MPAPGGRETGLGDGARQTAPMVSVRNAFPPGLGPDIDLI